MTSFSALYEIATDNHEIVVEVWDHSVGNGAWNLNFVRPCNDWEVEMIGNLLSVLQRKRVSNGVGLSYLEMCCWGRVLGEGGLYGPVTEGSPLFPCKEIWTPNVPPKCAFYAWEATLVEF